MGSVVVWAEPVCIANAVAAQTTAILPRSASFMTFLLLGGLVFTSSERRILYQLLSPC
jgi:hypothetical protein